MDQGDENTVRIGDVVIRQSPGVIEATLDRPKAVNALNDGMVVGLEHVVALAEKTEALLVVLRGAGGNFCAGADLKYVSILAADLENGLFPYIDRMRKICDALANGSFVSLAVIEGYAVAGGFEILTACDLAVCTADARIGDRHLEYGFAPGLGASVRVANHLGSKRVRYLALTGEMISGVEAAEWGLVSHVWARDVFEEKVAALIARLASRSPRALRLHKKLFTSSECNRFEDAILFEAEAFRDYQRASSQTKDGANRFKSERSDGVARPPQTAPR